MIGSPRFAFARARAFLPPLVTLAVVAALAAVLVVAVSGAIRSVEAHEVRTALAASTGEQSRLVVGFDEGASIEQMQDAVAAALASWGAGDGLDVEAADGRVVIIPDLDRITGDQVASLAEGLDGLRDAIEARTDSGAQVSGELDGTLVALHDQVQLRNGPTAVAVGLLGLMVAVVVGAVALETVRVRAGELHLLRARGARRRDLVGLAALETFLVAAVGAAVGSSTTLGVLTLLGAVSPGVFFGVVTTAVIAGLAVATVAVATYRGVDNGSSRARAAVSAGAIVVLAVVTGIALWQFAQAGTPIVERGDGAMTLDPLIAIAPALALGLAALLVVAVATPIARVITAALRPTRGVSPITPMRLALRRPGRHALPIVVVAFAVGSLTLAGAYQGSLTALGDAPEALRVGADVRVRTIPEDIDPAAIAAVQPSGAAMLVRPLSAEGADQRLSILGVEAPVMGDVMLNAGGTIDPAALGAAIELPSGMPLMGDTLSFTLSAPPAPPVVVDGEEVATGPAAANARLTVVSASGAIARFDTSNAIVSTVEDDGTSFTAEVDPEVSSTFDLPDGEEWSLAAVDVAYHPLTPSMGALEITGVTSGGEAVDIEGFRQSGGTPGSVQAIDGGLQFAPELDFDFDDLPYTRAVAPTVPAAIPAVVTAAIAQSMSLGDGERFSLEVASPGFPADFEVAAIVPVLPGTATGDGIAVDLATLALAAPYDVLPTQVWFASDEPDALAAAIHEQYDRVVVTAADPRSAENAAGTAAAFLLAAGGAVVLTFVVLVLRRTRSRADSRELALLAVMGLGRRRAARLRAGEDVFAIIMGAIGGVVAGAATAWLVVPPLVRAAYGSVPDTFPVSLQVQALPLGAALLVVVGVCCAIVSTVRAPGRLAPFVREDE